MKYVKLGRTGLEVSRICLGCMSYGDTSWQQWVLDEDQARDHFRTAVDLGINFFDTADMYSRGRSEEITGRYLREMTRRDETVIATKVYFRLGEGPNRQGLSRKHIQEACDASLKRLGIETIDLYQIHRFDFDTPIEETIEALDGLVRAGKVRYLGASSMAAWQFGKMLAAADAAGRHRFVTMQNHYNLAYREEEREMIPLCTDQGVGIIPWSPLARGFLSGSRRRDDLESTLRARSDTYGKDMYACESNFDVLDAIRGLAAERGVSPAQIALAWVLQAPGVTAPIIGTTRVEHITEAVDASRIQLDAKEIARLESPYRLRPVLGHRQPDSRRK